MKSSPHIKAILIAWMAASLSCQAAANGDAIAKVNGSVITKDDFVLRLREHRAGSDAPLGTSAESAELKDKVVRELIEETVMLHEARKRKIEVSPKELENEIQLVTRDYPDGAFDEMLAEQKMSRSRWRQQMERKLVLEKVSREIIGKVNAASPEAVDMYYKKHIEDFRIEAQTHLAQIVVKTEQEAQQMLALLREGKAFEDLGRKHSITPEASKGGDLGFLPKGTLPTALEEAVSNLAAGKLSAPIETEYGFHIVKVLEKKPAALQTLEEATPAIREILKQQEGEKKLSAWRQEVLSKVKVERNHGLIQSIH